MANEFRVRKKLIVNGSGSTILDVQGSQGQLFSVTDSLSGSLFSVKDISGIPVIEAFSDDTVNIGTFNAEAIRVSGSFARVTGSLFGTASWSNNAVTSSFATTASFLTGTVTSASYAGTASVLLGSVVSASYATFAATSSLATTASHALTASSADNFLVRQSITASNALINGTITAQTLVVQTITSSTDFVTGSTRFGSLLSNTHQFTGSVSITGSLNVVGPTTINNLTASVFGTSSWAQNSVSSSYALTASYALNAGGATSAFPYTGSARITGSINLTGSIYVTQSAISAVDWIDFTVNPGVPPHVEGRIHWNVDRKTLQIDTDVNNFMIPAGHSSVLRGRNTNSYTLTKGTVVYINGNSGQFATFGTASWLDEANSAYTIGIVAQDINTNNYGYAVTDGEIIGVNTNAFAPATLLYLSSSGQYTDQKPIPPYQSVRLGQVVVQSTSGILQVKVDNGYETDELHDVLLNNTSSGDLMVKSGSLWINSKQLTGSYGLTGSINITGSLRLSTPTYNTSSINVLTYNTGSSTVEYSTINDLTFTKNIVNVGLSGSRGVRYNTIKTAVQSITDASENNTYTVRVYPGIYIEDTITVPSWVAIKGDSSTSTVVSASNPSASIFVMSDQSMVIDMQIQGSTGPGASAIVYSSATTPQRNAIAYAENIRFGTNYTNAKVIGSGSSGNCILQCSNVKYGGWTDNTLQKSFDVGFHVTSGSGGGIGRMQLRNVTSTNGGVAGTDNNQIFALSDAPGCTFIVNGCLLTRATGTARGTAFKVYNGGQLRLTAVNFQRWINGIWAPQTGSAPSIDAIALNFENCTTDVLIQHTGSIGKVQGTDNFLKTQIALNAPLYEVGQDPRKITVGTKGADFTSISASVAYITDSSANNRYVIEVGPGQFTENMIDLTGKPYVSIVGSNIQTTQIFPSSSAQHIIKMGVNNEVSFLSLSGSGPGYSGLYVDNVGDFAQAHKVSIYNCDRGVTVLANSVDTQFYGEYIDINGTFSYGTYVSSSNGASVDASMENYFLFPSASAAVGNYIVGPSSSLGVRSAVFTGDGTAGSIAFQLQDGAVLEASSLDIPDWDTGVYIPNIGSGPTFRFVGAMIHESVTYDFDIQNSTTQGRFQGISNHTKINNNSEDFYWNFLDDVDGENDVTRKLSVTFADGTHTDATTLIFMGSSMGVLSGGEITISSSLTVTTAAGYGYLHDPINPEVFKRFDWVDSNITLSPNTNNYIYINSNGVLSASGTTPNFAQNIILGRVVTNDTGVEFIDQSPWNAEHTANRLSKFNRNALGPVFAEGSIVSENVTPFKLNVTQGNYYFSENNFLPSGTSSINLTQYYQSASVWARYTSSVVPNNVYASASVLAPMSASAYTKHTVYLVGDGVDEEYFLVVNNNQYSTLVQAENADLPTIPTYFNDGVVPLAAIYVQSGSANITQIQDIRPIIGFRAAGVNASSVHGNLLGLSADDHTQYLRVDGFRQMSNDLGLGGNDLYNVASVSASAITASGATITNISATTVNATSFVGALQGTASWATNAVTSYTPVSTTGSTIYSTSPATNNTNANNGIFLGSNAGSSATSANSSIFLGLSSGQTATNANESIFIGSLAGLEAAKANGSIFLGSGAGQKAVSASYSTIIGYFAGSTDDALRSIGTNNIILGNNITLPSKSRDSINIGAIIFATGSYSTLGSGNLYSGSQFGIGRVGINILNPRYTLDVSGSGNYTSGLTVSGSVIATSGFTGSLQGTASWAQNATSASFAQNAATASFWSGSITHVQSASFAQNAATASFWSGSIIHAQSASFAQFANTASFWSGSVVHVQSASFSATSISSSFASTASFATNFTASNILVNGTVTAQTLIVQTVTSSIDFVTGSTRFGSLLSNTHQFTGSVSVTGSLTVNNSPVILTSQTGSMSVLSSSFSSTASYVLNAVSSSFASTASFVNTLNQNVLITGSLTIGSSSIGSNENTLILGPSPAGGPGEGGQLLLQAPGGIYTSASMWDNWQNQTRLLRGTNAGSDAVIASFNMHSKQVQFPAYNSTTAFTGTTLVGLLGFDANGNLLTTTTSSGGGGGSVTILNNTDNFLLTATGTANTVNGESNLQFNGSTLSVTGNVTATSITSSGAVIAQANGAMYFRGGDDAEFWDINVTNTVGIYGQQDQTVGSLKLGNNGGTLSGWSGSIGVGTVLPNSGSLHVNGNIFATSLTGSLQGTASWANNAISSSYPIAVTGSTIYSTNPQAGIPSSNSTRHSIFLGSGSGFSTFFAEESNFLGLQSGYQANNAFYSNFLGSYAGFQATNASDSNFFGYQAGFRANGANKSVFIGNNAGYSASAATFSNFIGPDAGNFATNAYLSNFIGNAAGQEATNAFYSTFIGENAGFQATNADNSNFIGPDAGRRSTLGKYSNFIGYRAGSNAASASYSILIGYQAGYNVSTLASSIKSNNIVIGTNITLPEGAQSSINVGGLIFATGSYSTTTGLPFSGSTNGRVGINQPAPQFTLDVSGSGRYENGLTITGSLISRNITGSLFGTASWSQNSVSSSYAFNATTASFWSGSITHAQSASFAQFANTASFWSGSITHVQSASFAQNANTASFWSGSVVHVQSASFAQNANTASYVLNAVSASFATSAFTASSADTFLIRSGAIISGSLTVITGSSIELQVTNIGVKIGNLIVDTHTVTGSFSVSGSVTATNFTGSLFGTASYVTGSVFTSANPALSASYALTASYALNGGGGGGLTTKAGAVANTSFTGNPKKATVIFSTAFPNTSYAITVTGEDARSWTIQSKAASGFVIDSNSNTNLTGTTFWTAIAYGES